MPKWLVKRGWPLSKFGNCLARCFPIVTYRSRFSIERMMACAAARAETEIMHTLACRWREQCNVDAGCSCVRGLTEQCGCPRHCPMRR